MRSKMMGEIILWTVTAVCIVLSFVYFFKWRATANSANPVNKWNWIIFGSVALVCIMIWYFMRPKEEEISITRGG